MTALKVKDFKVSIRFMKRRSGQKCFVVMGGRRNGRWSKWKVVTVSVMSRHWRVTSLPCCLAFGNRTISAQSNDHTHMDRRTGNTDILDMAFIFQNLAIHDIQFQTGVDLGSDHLPIEISIDTTPQRNTFTNHTKYKFDQTDREVFESILEEAPGSEDFSGHLSTSDLDKYANFIVTALHTAVDKAIPNSKSVRPESNPISSETLALIKEKRKLRRLLSEERPGCKNAYQPVAETS